MASLNTSTSVVDYLKLSGKDASFGSRAQLAVKQGIVGSVNDYRGTATQNKSLLSSLQSSSQRSEQPVVDTSRVNTSNVSSVDDANARINQNNRVDNDQPEVRTSFQRSQDFFKDIDEVLTRDLGDAPDAPDFTQIYNEQRSQFGLTALETDLAEYQRNKREVEARLRERTNAQEGKTVPLNVIQGRIDETTRQERENIDFFNREIEYTSGLISSAYNAIDTIIGLEEKSFSAANTQYTNEFNRRKSMLDISLNLEGQEFDRNQDVIANARTNGEIIVNTAVQSGKSFEDLDTAAQINLQKMGIESGLGRNFFEDMFEAASNEEKEILTHVTSSDKNSVTVVYKDGTTDIIQTRGGGSTGSGSGTGGGETLSVLDITRLADTYGVTFPYGATDEQAQKFLQENAGKSPVEMQEILDAGGVDATGSDVGIETPVGDSGTLTRGYFVDNFTEDQLKSLADQTGNSSMFTGKQRDIDRFLDNYMNNIEALRSEGFQDYEIIDVLEEELGITL